MNPKKNEAEAKEKLDAAVLKAEDLCKDGHWQEAIDHMRSISKTFNDDGFNKQKYLAIREIDKIIQAWRSNIARQLSEMKSIVPSADVDEVIKTLDKLRDEARKAKFDVVIKDIDVKIETLAINSKRSDILERLKKIPQPWKAPDPDAALYQLEELERELRLLLSEITSRVVSTRVYGKLTKIFKVSRRISIVDFCKAINMDLEQALPLIYDLAIKLNFVIDGRFLELKDDNIAAAIVQIDQYFSDWRSREKIHADKI